MELRNIRYSSGKSYVFLAWALSIGFRLIFRKIYMHRRYEVPVRTPVILVANHPTAFIDPILFCSFFSPPVYNMTRGDIFAKPLFRKILMDFNMFPVFRRRDGYESRDRNDEVFEFCKKKLNNDQLVCIFVEGEHHLDRRVLPLQKGAARIAFGTYEAGGLENLQILPVGCNYDFGDRTRDEAKVVVGSPIMVKDYWETYQKSTGAAVSALCKDIHTALRDICLHIEDREDDVLVEQVLTLFRNDQTKRFFPVLEDSDGGFFSERAITRAINVLPAPEKALLKQQAQHYFDALADSGIADAALRHPKYSALRWRIYLLVFALPAALGGILSWPVRAFTRWLAAKTVKKKEFYTSVLLGVGTLSGLFYAAVLCGLAWAFCWPWLAVLALSLPLWTWLFLTYRELLSSYWAARKATNTPQRETLLALRPDYAPLLRHDAH
jgi:glycerol-3-phosphate O-acyltransferase / dihydroxyacetone phosphate acyltransferase